MALLGGIEAGGTKLICAAARLLDEPIAGSGETPAGSPSAGAIPEIVDEARIPTTTPTETLARAVAFFRGVVHAHGHLDALGMASFGPLDLDPASPRRGSLTATPKPGWAGTDLVRPFREAFAVPVALDTDVQGAALAEHRWGAGRGCALLVYVTAGTGIGGAALHDGRPLHPHRRAELGHIHVPRHPADRTFAGVCPFHRDCVEGLASGPAVVARWGHPLEALPHGHEAWEVLGHYLGGLAAALVLTLAPDRILFGGGLFTTDALLDPARRACRQALAGYPTKDTAADEGFLQRPALGPRAGVLGALALAEGAAVASSTLS